MNRLTLALLFTSATLIALQAPSVNAGWGCCKGGRSDVSEPTRQRNLENFQPDLEYFDTLTEGKKYKLQQSDPRTATVQTLIQDLNHRMGVYYGNVVPLEYYGRSLRFKIGSEEGKKLTRTLFRDFKKYIPVGQWTQLPTDIHAIQSSEMWPFFTYDHEKKVLLVVLDKDDNLNGDRIGILSHVTEPKDVADYWKVLFPLLERFYKYQTATEDIDIDIEHPEESAHERGLRNSLTRLITWFSSKYNNPFEVNWAKLYEIQLKASIMEKYDSDGWKRNNARDVRKTIDDIVAWIRYHEKKAAGPSQYAQEIAASPPPQDQSQGTQHYSVPVHKSQGKSGNGRKGKGKKRGELRIEEPGASNSQYEEPAVNDYQPSNYYADQGDSSNAFGDNEAQHSGVSYPGYLPYSQHYGNGESYTTPYNGNYGSTTGHQADYSSNHNSYEYPPYGNGYQPVFEEPAHQPAYQENSAWSIPQEHNGNFGSTTDQQAYYPSNQISYEYPPYGNGYQPVFEQPAPQPAYQENSAGSVFDFDMDAYRNGHYNGWGN